MSKGSLVRFTPSTWYRRSPSRFMLALSTGWHCIG
eukprot:CAMPEP_0179959764 /NCGR_PEP_ID=MMETSP0983-20121128/28745_1 /TAXON_ID=483367 /ORGANISM="non described non described, Strain CCMP 2436" /LENGTH=34 /DNA_ID= /DNA_START= /DNA_END= /DNA_ORIENTATION=